MTRKMRVVLAMVMVLGFGINVANADINLEEFAKGLGGVAVSLGIHSASHLLVGEIRGSGIDMDLDGRWKSDRYDIATQMAGLGVNLLTSETLLNTAPVKEWGFIREGLFWGSVAQEILYPIFERGITGGNDFYKMDRRTKKLFKIIFTSHGALSIARYFWGQEKNMSFGLFPDNFLGGAQLFVKPVMGGGIIGFTWLTF